MTRNLCVRPTFYAALLVLTAFHAVAGLPPNLDPKSILPPGDYPVPFISLPSYGKLERMIRRIGHTPRSKLDSFNFTHSGFDYAALLGEKSITICRLLDAYHCTGEQLDLRYETREALYVYELTNSKGCGVRVMASLDPNRVPLRAESGEILKEPTLFSWECGYRKLYRAEILARDGRVYDYTQGLVIDEVDGRVQTLPLLSPSRSHLLSPKLVPAEMDLSSPLFEILLLEDY